MKFVAMAKCLSAALTVAAFVGCAPAYHSYSGCYVDCKYCPPPPLPYRLYDGCVCHSCAAAKYLSVQSPPIESANEETESVEPTQ